MLRRAVSRRSSDGPPACSSCRASVCRAMPAAVRGVRSSWFRKSRNGARRAGHDRVRVEARAQCGGEGAARRTGVVHAFPGQGLELARVSVTDQDQRRCQPAGAAGASRSEVLERPACTTARARSVETVAGCSRGSSRRAQAPRLEPAPSCSHSPIVATDENPGHAPRPSRLPIAKPSRSADPEQVACHRAAAAAYMTPWATSDAPVLPDPTP